MENLCKIVTFGDSITRAYSPGFADRITAEYPEKHVTVLNEGADGETTRDAVRRLPAIVRLKPDAVVVGLGMNDWRNGVPPQESRENLDRLVVGLEACGARVVLLTLNPVRRADRNGSLAAAEGLSRQVREVARRRRVRVADVHQQWGRTFRPARKGLADEIHPNERGYGLYHDVLMQVVPRANTTVLWQFNGNPCACNYRCPYCPDSKAGHHFFGTVEQWHEGFKRSFGNQKITFYISFGEPTIARNFYDVLEMIGSEDRWELMMTSNLSQDLGRLLDTRLAREGRLNINASFHPYDADLDAFLDQLRLLRSRGIESPIIYVMYPPIMKDFEGYLERFSAEGFLMHVRRYEGCHGGRTYPVQYTEEQRRYIARFMDDANIRYMLNNKWNYGDLCYAGVYYLIVDNVGNIGFSSDYFPHYSVDRCRFGNILQGNIHLPTGPMPFPGGTFYGTVDGVANAVELDYKELEGNHVASFMAQGGVYKADEGVFYKNLDTDFDDPAIRARLGMPSRDMRDRWQRFRHAPGKAHYLGEHVLRGAGQPLWRRLQQRRIDRCWQDSQSE